MPAESRYITEQRRKAKEWNDRFCRLSMTPDSQETPPPQPLSAVDAAKLAAQERIKSQAKAKAAQISTHSRNSIGHGKNTKKKN